METKKEIKELEEKLSNIKLKPFPLWKRIGLLILIISIIVAGYFS